MQCHAQIITICNVSSQPNIASHEALFASLQRKYPTLFVEPGVFIDVQPLEPVVSMHDSMLFAVSKLQEPERHTMLLQMVSALSADDIAAKLCTRRDVIVERLRSGRMNVIRYLRMCG
jgi:hypothetical protein